MKPTDRRRTARTVLTSVLTMLALGAGTVTWAVATKQPKSLNDVSPNVQMLSQWGTSKQPKLKDSADRWQKQRFTFTTSVSGNLFYPTDSVKGTLSAQHPKSTTIPISVRVFDAQDRIVSRLQPLTLSKNNKYALSFALPKGPGYYRIALEVGGQKHEFNARYAVIPPNLKAGKNLTSPFGVNTHFNQGWSPAIGKIVKRAGIAWIRDGEASLNDRAVVVAKANQLCYLPVFTHYRAPLDKNKRADGTWDFSDVAQWHRQYAAKYGADIDYYDLVNEPHVGWMEKLGGSWDGGPWQQPFVVYGRQVTKAIKTGDPGATVLWEDIDQLVWYRQFHTLGAAADTIDKISPHPYNLHRDNPFPETHPMLGQLPEFHQFVNEKKLPWTVWSGEVGFSSFRGPNLPLGFTPYTELQQAQLLVRMMVGQLASGVEKIFWYDMRNDGWQQSNPEHNFGLIRNDNQPKPALVAYTNLIHQVGDGEWLGRVQIGDAFAYAFVSQQTSQPVLVAWTKTGSKTFTVPVSGKRKVTLSDIYGTTRQVLVQNGKLQLELTGSPVYIKGLSRQAIAPLL